MSDGADVRILNKLVEWAGQVKWPQGSVAGYWTTTALTVEEYAEKTRPFMADRAAYVDEIGKLFGRTVEAKNLE
ncbi:hypothetical protein SCUCBS95973_003696 [Sporothrix curviconia]|uniref:Uncharacterized protein n=1 Tax=Sporothrix curviconia TaxID=1260050 RepID=A0ABP0BIH9_9PEZI